VSDRDFFDELAARGGREVYRVETRAELEELFAGGTWQRVEELTRAGKVVYFAGEAAQIVNGAAVADLMGQIGELAEGARMHNVTAIRGKLVELKGRHRSAGKTEIPTPEEFSQDLSQDRWSVFATAAQAAHFDRGVLLADCEFLCGVVEALQAKLDALGDATETPVVPAKPDVDVRASMLSRDKFLEATKAIAPVGKSRDIHVGQPCSTCQGAGVVHVPVGAPGVSCGACGGSGLRTDWR
jgi:hypothetical protein